MIIISEIMEIDNEIDDEMVDEMVDEFDHDEIFQ
jgi:hypothetical protein